jgi:adenylate cyclase
MPLTGLGSAVLRLLDMRASMLTPKLCNRCEKMILSTEGGAEVELSLLFADMRGSTRLSEQKGTTEYIRLIQRFYKTAAQAIIERNGMVNRLIGDQVIGMFVPRFSGPEHPAVAIDAALDILRRTGHADPDGPWAPIGIGVHCGTAYVGAVGSKEGLNEIAVLGNAANLAARLSSNAAEGELLVSEQAAAIAKPANLSLETRRLTLKGISQPVTATVMTLGGE